MGISKHFASAVSAAVVAVMILTTPAPAQPPAQASSAAAPNTSKDTATVTIFATRHYSTATAQSELAREHPLLSCIFGQKKDGRKHANFASGTPASKQSDLEASMGGDGDSAILAELDPCNSDPEFFNNPRVEILAHDKSLDKAFAAYDAGKYDEALPLFKYAWNKMGYDMAGLMVGKMYLLGHGTTPDIKQAIYWFKTVVEVARSSTPTARHPETTVEQKFDPSDPNYMSSKSEAAMYLARIYENGYKVPRDAKEARKYYIAADEFGFMPATHAVAEMYLSGYGGETNVKEAIKHFVRAGSIGYAPSQYALGEIYYFGEFGIPQDKALAGAWLLKAAKGGNADAQYAVARMYELGEGGAKVDPAKAIVYYKEAALKDQPEAQYALGQSFYTGSNVPQDLKTARDWFEQAAENGNPDAMFNLAVMMVNGEGGPKDLVKAYCWFYIAQKGGNDKAGAALAELAPKMTADERAQAEALLNPPPAK